MEYKIISGGVSMLCAEVNKLMAQGWIPIGGLCVSETTMGSTDRFAQALIKEGK